MGPWLRLVLTMPCRRTTQDSAVASAVENGIPCTSMRVASGAIAFK